MTSTPDAQLGTPGRGSQRPTPSSGKFKGNCAELLGYILFDCSDYSQADKYITNIKRIAEYLGTAYKQGGNPFVPPSRTKSS
jgi:hypothetical protein